ncbi:hypothetical protein D3C74_275730 [compost metagenome]
MTTRRVRFLLRPRLARAMQCILAPRVDFLNFVLFLRSLSIYLTASTGDTLAAILPGLKMLMNTVISVNNAAPIKIHGLGDTDTSVPAKAVLFIISGTSDLPTIKPMIKPMGIPITERCRACLRMILRICLPLVPIVFSRP